MALPVSGSPDVRARAIERARFALERVVLIDQDALAGTFRIVELARVDSPEKGPEAGRAEQKGKRDEIDEPGQEIGSFDLVGRIAFSVTITDEADMAMAATSGVANPATAMGTATML